MPHAHRLLLTEVPSVKERHQSHNLHLTFVGLKCVLRECVRRVADNGEGLAVVFSGACCFTLFVQSEAAKNFAQLMRVTTAEEELTQQKVCGVRLGDFCEVTSRHVRSKC